MSTAWSIHSISLVMRVMKSLGSMSEKELKSLKAKITKQIGQRVRVEREKKNLTQEELAERAGFYRTYIGHIETGAYSPSVFTMWRIAQALKVDIDKLLKGL
jgi:DNA-binding XRE family transcriptional regulator